MQLTRAQQHMKQVANGKHREVNFEVGELVYLKLISYHQKSVEMRPHVKLSPRYFRLFEVEAKIFQFTYKLKFPTNAALYPVVHASQLRRAIRTVHMASHLPSQLTFIGQFQKELEMTLRTRQNPSAKSQKCEFSGKIILSSRPHGNQLS